MYVCKDEKIKYKCSAPTERRIALPSVDASRHQWVLDIVICDMVTTSDIDELLDGEFYLYDEETENTVRYPDYTVINNVEMRYSNDLSCTVKIQLAKEVTK